jgi:hypothetical protein
MELRLKTMEWQSGGEIIKNRWPFVKLRVPATLWQCVGVLAHFDFVGKVDRFPVALSRINLYFSNYQKIVPAGTPSNSRNNFRTWIDSL